MPTKYKESATRVDRATKKVSVEHFYVKQISQEEAFKMLNDPKAIEKSYVPDGTKDVVAFTRVIDPKATHTVYFKAPKEKGEYPYICTFPGHWQAMQGVMVVE